MVSIPAGTLANLLVMLVATLLALVTIKRTIYNEHNFYRTHLAKMRLRLAGCMNSSSSPPSRENAPPMTSNISGPASASTRAKDRHVVLSRDAASGKAVLQDTAGSLGKSVGASGLPVVRPGGYTYTSLQETMRYIRCHTD
jgi:hypothetical protein